MVNWKKSRKAIGILLIAVVLFTLSGQLPVAEAQGEISLNSPKSNNLYSVEEPLHLSGQFTSSNTEGYTAEAVITKDGQSTTVPLTMENGVFEGDYEHSGKGGEYNLEIKILQGGQVIARTTDSFTLGTVPTVAVDYWEKDTQIRLGYETSVSSYLNIGGRRLTQGDGLKIRKYDLVLDYDNGDDVVIGLQDNGDEDYADIKANDGIWSNRVVFKKQDSGKAYISVGGTYNGSSFVGEKELGEFTFLQTGKIDVTALSQELYTRNNKVNIPLHIESTSQFPENLQIQVDESIGTVVNGKVSVEPESQTDIEVQLQLNEGFDGKGDVPIKVTADNALTQVNHMDMTVSVEKVSLINYLIRSLQAYGNTILILLAIVIVVPLAIVLLGSLSYRINVYKTTFVTGKLIYGEEGTELSGRNALELERLKAEKVVISFDEDNKEAQFHLPNEEYHHNLVIYMDREKSKWKFVDGWKALFKKREPSTMILRTTEPGIFMYEDKVYTRKKLYDYDRFTSGGYRFEYQVMRVEAPKDKDKSKGKNVLEGLS